MTLNKLDETSTANRMLELTRQRYDGIDDTAAALYPEVQVEGTEQAVFCLLVDVAVRYAELIAARRPGDVTQPLDENLEMIMATPAWRAGVEKADLDAAIDRAYGEGTAARLSSQQRVDVD